MDKIYLKNIEIFANHGVFQEEKALGQKFILSLELSLDFHKAAKDGDLSASVHYGELCHNVEKVFKEEVCDLLETLVYKVGDYVLDTYEVVKEVKISLKKPWAPISRHLDYAAVETTIARHKAYIALGSNIGNNPVTSSNTPLTIALVTISFNISVPPPFFCKMYIILI